MIDLTTNFTDLYDSVRNRVKLMTDKNEIFGSIEICGIEQTIDDNDKICEITLSMFVFNTKKVFDNVRFKFWFNKNNQISHLFMHYNNMCVHCPKLTNTQFQQLTKKLMELS